MPLYLRERQVQAAARRIGLKLIRLKAIVDRYHADETGRNWRTAQHPQISLFLG